MILLEKEQICLLELIKASLFGLTPVIPDNVYWEKVLDLATIQCIVPLVASCVPEEHRNGWLEISCQSKAHFIKILYEQNSLLNLFRSNNIPFVILKGTAASIYYQSPFSRTFGDIDFYVPSNQADTAKILLEENGYVYLSSDERHHEFEKNGIDFELHSKIGSKHYSDVEHVFKKGFENAVEYKLGSFSFPGLPTYENGLVLLGHIMQHLKASGIGLRQIIDWMMFVHKNLDDSAWENSFRALSVEAGLEKLAVSVTFLCKKWLGLPDDISWCDEADVEVVDQLLIRLLDDGNFGQDRAPYENIRISIKQEGLFKHLQRCGIENWNLAQRYSIFRSFAWLYQFFRYAGQGLVRLFTGKKVFKNDKQSISLEALWKDLE